MIIRAASFAHDGGSALRCAAHADDLPRHRIVSRLEPCAAPQPTTRSAMRTPPVLRPGDTVAVIAPGAAVAPQAVDAGIRTLEELGFFVQRGRHLLSQHGYLAGSDAERLADLEEAFANPAIKGIFAARGGYGCGRLLPQLRPEAFSQPKVFVGHSDLTFLFSYLVEATDLVVFHGPLVADLRPDAARSVTQVVQGDRASWRQVVPEIIRSGTGEGRLVGGCLSIITAMLGTPWAIPTRGRLLFLEDVNEKPYRIDRMLTQLRQGGAFDGVAGVIFGEMVGCSAGSDEQVTVRDVIREAFQKSPFPVAFGLPSGHGSGTAVLPLGVRARLSGDRLTLLEPPLTY